MARLTSSVVDDLCSRHLCLVRSGFWAESRWQCWRRLVARWRLRSRVSTAVLVPAGSPTTGTLWLVLLLVLVLLRPSVAAPVAAVRVIPLQSAELALAPRRLRIASGALPRRCHYWSPFFLDAATDRQRRLRSVVREISCSRVEQAARQGSRGGTKEMPGGRALTPPSAVPSW
jgi:hypothetical protein